MEQLLWLLLQIHEMKKIAQRFILVSILTFFLQSCHKDQSYYCYLIEDNLWYNDTLASYNEGFWFHKKKSVPEDECYEDKVYQDSVYEANFDFFSTCSCSCGWEAD